MAKTQTSLFRPVTLAVMFIGLILFTCKLSAQPVLKLGAPVITGLTQPMQIINADDGTNRFFVIQKGGLIKCYDQNFNFLSDFLTVTNITSSGERGLLSMAFHPDYETNGLFYVYYTGNEPGKEGALTIARYKVDANDPQLADPASKKIVLEILHPRTNHNGGQLHFDQVGYLFLTTGDGGGGGDPDENSQDPTKLLGKLLRMEVNTSETAPFYTIPASNPFGNEVYCLGLRNPYRWSFDRLNGDIWIGDVGQSNWEEIDHVIAANIKGTNFGWDCYEGNEPYELTGCLPEDNYKFPFYVYTKSGSQSVTGGVVYRGSKYPTLYGWYVGAEFYNTDFHRVYFDGSTYTIAPVQTLGPGSIVNFGEGEDGEVYVVSLYEGEVYPLEVEEDPLSVNMLDVDADRKGNLVKVNWTTSQEEDCNHFEIEWSVDGRHFEKAGTVKAKNTQVMNHYTFEHNPDVAGTLYYRIKAIDVSNSYKYSGIVMVSNEREFIAKVYPTAPDDDVVNILFSEIHDKCNVEVLNNTGNRVFSTIVMPGEKKKTLSLHDNYPGIYFVRIIAGKNTETHKIVKNK